MKSLKPVFRPNAHVSLKDPVRMKMSIKSHNQRLWDISDQLREIIMMLEMEDEENKSSTEKNYETG